jgi:DNA polymerase III delta prime subunit
MDIIKELNVLMEDINNQISDSENITDKKGYQYIAWYDFLKNIKGKLENETYKFIFIGQKGIGKTTTILELFGLIKKNDLENHDLLTTAAGGTTTCEVELLKSDKPITYLEIEPIDVQLLNQYIDDFCSIFYDKENIGENSYLPSEIARSIRNMISLKKKDIELLRNDYKDINKFKEEILRRIDIQNRNRTIIECQSANGTFFKDCQEKFNAINLCKIKDVMLPKRIKIFLTKDIFDFAEIPFVSSIVDTRGIDTILSSSSDSNKMKREDILNYIDREQNNCLFFFIDNIKPAPSQGISELLRTRLSIGNEFRFYLIMNIIGKEAEEVMTDDGKAGTMQIGIEYKKEDILDKFKQLNIHLPENNLLFYNAKENNPENKYILDCIENNLSSYKKYLFKLCDEIKKAYYKLKFDFENNQYALKNFEQLQMYVENVNAPNNVFDMLLEIFIRELQNIHHARLAAINRYEGEYYAFNFFHEISLIVENLFDDFFAQSKIRIIDKVNEFINYRNITEIDKINYHVFLEKFENDYSEYRNQLKEFIKMEIKKCFHARTWDQAVAEYGQGKGYKNRVLDIYKNELMIFASKIDVRNSYNSKWGKVVEENTLLPNFHNG